MFTSSLPILLQISVKEVKSKTGDIAATVNVPDSDKNTTLLNDSMASEHFSTPPTSPPTDDRPYVPPLNITPRSRTQSTNSAGSELRASADYQTLQIDTTPRSRAQSANSMGTPHTPVSPVGKATSNVLLVSSDVLFNKVSVSVQQGTTGYSSIVVYNRVGLNIPLHSQISA